MELVTAEEMRRIDRHTIDAIGIPEIALMENAGRALADAVVRLVRRTGWHDMDAILLEGSKEPDAGEAGWGGGKPWAVLVGKGHNGGDGLIAARHLALRGVPVRIIYATPPEELRGEAARQRDIAERLQLPAGVYAPGAVDWSAMGGIVDALLGTGTGGTPREPYAALIREANASGLPIVAADLPSGLDPDTGQTADPCIRATLTVTFGLPKRGLVQYPGAEAAGTVLVAPIGIPAGLAAELGVSTWLLTPETLRNVLDADPDASRQPDGHKGTYGHVLVAAGTRAMSGAGLLCATAALRSGAGLVTWAVPELLAESLIGAQPELMLAPVADGGRGDWLAADPLEVAAMAARRDALVVGPGLGRVPGSGVDGRGWLRRLWEALPPELPLVVDADALNHLAEAGDFAAWPKRPDATVFTPHPGELARLTGLPARDIQRDRIGVAREYALRHGVTLVLKGARTVVADPFGDVYVNPTGNPGMATGGTGDVLAGVIAGLLAQGYPATAAAALGVYRHGAAGDRAAAKRRSPASLIAGDLLAEL